jgi:hypothetical protein
MEITTVKYIKEDIEKLSAMLRYDPETGHLFWLQQVSTRRVGDQAGNKRSDGYVKVQLNGKPFKAHRLAWALHFSEWPEGEIDHINGDRSDNRIVNLRVVNRKQNNHNRRPQVASSKYKGVQWHKAAGKWVARAYLEGKRTHLGVFSSEEDAAKAYNASVAVWYGKYAVLNNVDMEK